MEWWHAVLLGALQGVTEFLPISSSGHLVLAQQFTDLGSAHGGAAALFFDGSLHLGTAIAVLIYFRKGVRQQLRYFVELDSGASAPWPANRADLARLAGWLVLGTLPVAIVTLFFRERIKESFADPSLVAVNFLILGFILLLTDLLPPGQTRAAETRWWQVAVIGVGQAFSAVFRGLSRSGMTVAAALGVGLHRDWAVRFSFLMAIVASLGWWGLGVLQALSDPEVTRWMTPEFLGNTLLGTVTSGVVGYLTIEPLIHLVQRARLWWFSVYLWLLGGGMLLSRLMSP